MIVFVALFIVHITRESVEPVNTRVAILSFGNTQLLTVVYHDIEPIELL